MGKFTEQMEKWSGNFGREYTDRNALSLQELEVLYKGYFGITRTEMNYEFIGDLDRNMNVLEVGSNIGNELQLLQNMGFRNLYGIELQSYAVELSKSRTKGINIIQGSAFDIPFRDAFFDLIFTSGLLIHIAPKNIIEVMDEMYRCAKRFIWGMEYYSKEYAEVVYRGYDNLLWKTDFPQLFLDRFKGLRLVKEKLFKYLSNDNIDVMFLLEKK
jgi:pseudaminic acid biosynthesis-associated methylase